MRRGAAIATIALLAACGGGDGPTGTERGAPPAAPSAAPALRPVVSEAIATLEAELALAGWPPGAPSEAAVESAREPTLGLLEALAGTATHDSMRRAMLAELAGLGDAAVPHLADRLADREADPSQREAAAEVLGAIDSAAAAEVLLAVVDGARQEVDPERWLAAQCAWRLGETAQDQTLPSVLLSLKYETDHETVLWLAATAAHFGNYAGLEALRVIAASGSETAERASGLYGLLTAGFDPPYAAELAWAERGEVAEAYRHDPSPRLVLATWRQIAALAGWQLRGVDDARFVLARSAPYAAERLARALSDEDVYVRVHAAQCLERMGPRGRAAEAALVAALDDPRAAPAAAAALGALAAPDGPAVEALTARLVPGNELELRVAAARALGLFALHPDPAALAAPLEVLAADAGAPLDLRAAAAAAVVRIAPLERIGPAEALLRELEGSLAVEPGEIRSALEALELRRQPSK